jgi:hypothetical protein
MVMAILAKPPFYGSGTGMLHPKYSRFILSLGFSSKQENFHGQ